MIVCKYVMIIKQMILVIGSEILIQDYVLMTVVVNLKILLLVIVLISALQAIGEIPII